MYNATFKADGIPAARVMMFSLKAMSLDYREWIAKNNLGASQCHPVIIYVGTEATYILSYNGKVWDSNDEVEV